MSSILLSHQMIRLTESSEMRRNIAMPLLQITTNQEVARPDAEVITMEAGRIVAETIGKPESVMMASLRSDACLAFGGTFDPAALFEIEGIELSAEFSDMLSNRLSDLAEENLTVPASRVFVKLTNVPRGNWAGNRRVF